MSSIAKYENVSTRAGFNTVVRHVKATISYVEVMSEKKNLADAFIEDANSEDLSAERIAAILRMTLVDKFGYRVVSRNLGSVCENLEAVIAEILKWNAVDVVLAYHHPDLGLLTANPKNVEQLAAFGTLRKRELAVAYVGRFDKASDDLCERAAEIALTLLEGGKVTIPATLYKGDCVYKVAKKKEAKVVAPKKTAVVAKRGRPATVSASKAQIVAEAPVPVVVETPIVKAVPVASGPRPGSRMTPMYSVTVQNELFHNGNVEAWKRIIESYKIKYPGLEVYIYYDGERILNINSLFKWGKVKHGSTIQFAVAGNEIKDVAKLQRYLIQGASHMFESFLHGPVSTVLKLF
ncbi:MAG: hypothetical protein WCT14_18885 [Treponemataceae bacterium]